MKFGSYLHSGVIICQDCGVAVKRRSSTHILCSACRRKRRRAAKKIANAKRKKKVLGRECKWCGETDAGGKDWSSNNCECGACNKQRSRHKCFWCGGPFYVTSNVSNRGMTVGCIQQCAEQNESVRGERRRLRLQEERWKKIV